MYIKQHNSFVLGLSNAERPTNLVGAMGGWREERERGVKEETGTLWSLVVKDLAEEFGLDP